MGYSAWILFIGMLLVATSMAAGVIHRGPITSFAVYLGAGIVVGPAVLGLARISFDHDNAEWLRAVTETGLVVSLFITGLKLRVPFGHGGWMTATRLAIPAMLLTIGGIMALAHVALGWSWPLALALAAILSPTDPVLASLVSVDDARDDDALRVALSGEAGLNDGTALPFLLLALTLITTHEGGVALWMHWAGIDLAWGWLAGIGLGFGIGWLVGYAGTHMRHVTQDVAPSDFLALGIMALAYGGAELVHASGFLAAFAAGVGLRRVEVRVAARHSEENPEAERTEGGTAPAELLVRPNERSTAGNDHPVQTVGWVVSDALSFGDTIERLIGAALVFVVGVAVLPAFSWAGALVALILFVGIRPASVWLSTARDRLPWQRRLLLGWFGIRGLGSLNYLAYALTHGLAGRDGDDLSTIALTVVALSIFVHGMTTTPLMNWRGRALERQRRKTAIK
ncbi:MAG TPA: cation:proton antiporter [Luteibacter sp.]|uniref:cation:proton antiporter n=1 Tax=Luteibacter sp. TaxID=1886636 RepID=UPI002BFB8092|nr:cation:proton antiporter [Luteibacter sp.]HVI55619.1 cation:proton antiporter [Luteibacter sp.]